MEASGESRQPKQNPLSFFSYMKNGVNSESDEEPADEPDNGDENPFSFKAFYPGANLPSAQSKDSAPKSRETKDPLRIKSDLRSSSDSTNSDSSFPPPLPPVLPMLDDDSQRSSSEITECSNCRRLTKENKRLRVKLQEAVDSAAQLQKRVSKLSTQLKAREERESKEASQLEEMLHQVEKNLHQSTKRADEAERNVGRLSREVAQLHAQLQSGDCPQRSREVGVELVESSIAAKQMLKQLLKGVDRLSMIGESLQMDTKFSDA